MTSKTSTSAPALRLAAVVLCTMLGACGMMGKPERGYGIGPQAEQEAALERTNRQSALPDSPGMYLAHIDAYEKRYGRSPESSLRRADALRQADQLDASRSAYETLLKTPLASRGWPGLGLIAGQGGDFAAAVERFEEAVKRAPTYAPTLSDLGYARLRLGDIAGARVPLMKATELARDNPKIQKNLVLFLLASGPNDAAREIMTNEKFSPETRRAMDASVKQVLDAAKSEAAAAIAKNDDRSEAPAAGRSTWRSLLDAAKSIAAPQKGEAVAATATTAP